LTEAGIQVLSSTHLLHEIGQFLSGREAGRSSCVNKKWKDVMVQYASRKIYRCFLNANQPRPRKPWSEITSDILYVPQESEQLKWQSTSIHNFTPPMLMNKFTKSIQPLINACQEFRTGDQIGSGKGRLLDVVDPSFNVDSDLWVSTSFQLRGGVPTITSEIPGVSLYHRDLYDAVETLFKKVLPHARNHLNGDDTFDWQNGRLDTILTTQVYQLQPGESIRGEMHQDGLPEENIALTAIWYFDVPDELQGGNLVIGGMFPRYCASSGFREHPVEVKNNSLIMFDNLKWLHRVGEMINPTGRMLERKILTFFILKPGIQGVTSREVTVNADILDLATARTKKAEMRNIRIECSSQIKQRDFNKRRFMN